MDPPRATGAQRLVSIARCRYFVLFALLFAAHSWLLSGALQNGDSAIYNDQIERSVINIRTPHIGYIVCGIVVSHLLPLDVDRSMNVMCLAFAAAGAAAAYSIARSLRISSGASLVAPLLVFGIVPYLRGAVLAEVDVVSCALVLVSVALWLRRWRVGAGLAFGFAMLVTPVSAPSLPMLIFTTARARGESRRWRGHLRDVLLFGVVSLTVYVLPVIAVWHDYYYGGRGILRAPREPWNVEQQITRSVDFLVASGGPWLAIGLASLTAGIIRRTPLSLGAGVALIATAIFAERTLDVPVQLPQLCVVAVFAVLLVSRLPSKALRWSTLATLYGLAAWPAYRSVFREVRANTEARKAFLAMAAQTPKLIFVGGDSWNDGLRFERYVYRRTRVGFGMSFRDFRGAVPGIVRERTDYAILTDSEPPVGLMAPFAEKWRHERRTLGGRPYDVWLPLRP